MSRTTRARRAARPVPPPRGALVVALLLAALGLALSLYLARLHVRAHAGLASFCDVNDVVNCDRVATSAYSVALGIPVAVWGAIGYALAGCLAALGVARRGPHPGWPRGLLFALAAAAAAVSIALALVSELAIGAWCLVCAASWLVSFGLLAASWRGCRALGGPLGCLRADVSALAARPGATVFAALAGAVSLAALAFAYPRYWVRAPTPRQAAIASPPPAAPAPSRTSGAGSAEPAPPAAAAAPPAGPTASPKHPGRHGPGRATVDEKRGPAARAAAPAPARPQITIVEYSDYECPYCALAHEQTRALLAARPDIRIIHRQFPLDATCNPALKRTLHPEACSWARAGICGEEQGKSRAMDEALFANQKDRLPVQAVAERAGLDLARFQACLSAPETERRLSEDIAAARRQGIAGTPAYVIGGETYLGRLPESIVGPAARSAQQP
jgi:uncharacterized membrane protein/protein-disulfide isomerase